MWGCRQMIIAALVKTLVRVTTTAQPEIRYFVRTTVRCVPGPGTAVRGGGGDRVAGCHRTKKEPSLGTPATINRSSYSFPVAALEHTSRAERHSTFAAFDKLKGQTGTGASPRNRLLGNSYPPEKDTFVRCSSPKILWPAGVSLIDYDGVTQKNRQAAFPVTARARY